MNAPHEPSLASRALVIVGGGALLVAMAADGIAVIGRHTGLPLLGSIELVQAAVLVAASAALIVATAARTHAVVHLIVDRVSKGAGDLLLVANRIAAALFFLALAVGSVWIAIELWNGHEESELLRIPYRPLRLIAIGSAAACFILFVHQALTARRGR